MLPLITAKAKDDVLKWLCQNIPPNHLTQIPLPDAFNTIPIKSSLLRAILEHFQEIGLIGKLIQTEEEDRDILVILKVKAHDLLSRGGFTVEDALNEANIQKILLELEKLQKQLKPDQVDLINKIGSIAASIATVFTAFSSRN